MGSLEELQDHLLAECKEDEVGLWYIVKHVREEVGVQDAAEVRRITLQLVRRLLDTGIVVAGWYPPPDSGLPRWQIAPRPMPVDEIISRIEAEWDRLGREPNIAEIVILQARPED